jgi:16S rRNA (guanine966-N2)-methyltransferase
VRISGGVAKGLTLTVPPGTRPTTDRVREAIFNSLTSMMPLTGQGLDLYAGSGALGIEALSRGLDLCDFVDSRAVACRSIRDNLQRAGLSERATVLRLDATHGLGQLVGPYSLVFADPPYADDSALAPLDALAPRLGGAAVMVVEHSGRVSVPSTLAGLKAQRSKRYGDNAVTFYGRES